MRLVVLLCSWLLLTSGWAQEPVSPAVTPALAPTLSPILSPTPSPTLAPRTTPSPTATAAPARSIVLRFALPPLEGSISLGIYDQAGKLVRVLQRESGVDQFTAGHDALETSWDGTDDDGQPLPNGKYHARGYVVGDLKVEGVAYFFNDWVTDDQSIHPRRLLALKMENDELRVEAELADGRKAAFSCDQKTGAMGHEVAPAADNHCSNKEPGPNLIHPLDCAPGKNDTNWYVDAPEASAPRQIKQLSRDQELLRRLDYAAADPQPECIEASVTEDKIFVLEQDTQLQRLRGLSLVRTTTEGSEGTVSDWQTLFEKRIVAHQNFGLEGGQPVAQPSASPPASQKIVQKLRPDPLQNDRRGQIELEVAHDGDGSFLQAADGLPLRTISDNPNLIRTLVKPSDKDTIEIFQDDGAVVEQFRLSHLDEMIAIDCGDFELK